MRKQAGVVLGRSWFAMLALALSLVVAAAATSIARPGRTGGSASAGTAKKRPPLPDLVEKSVSRLPSTTHPGQGFTVVDRVKNVGRATAPKSVTKFYLETKLAHDRHLQVPAWYLGPRRVPPRSRPRRRSHRRPSRRKPHRKPRRSRQPKAGRPAVRRPCRRSWSRTP